MLKKLFEKGGTIGSYDDNKNFSKSSAPEKLQEDVYFNIKYFLGTHGREWIKNLTKRNNA